MATQTHTEAVATAQIKNVVQSVAVYADTRRFRELKSFFSPQVNVDYTSAFGGSPETVSSDELMLRWSKLLPGFDCTRHEVSDIKVNVQDGGAEATAAVVADHWFGEKHWQVSGSYKYKLSKKERNWVVDSMTFLLTGEKGSRDILQDAMSAASAFEL